MKLNEKGAALLQPHTSEKDFQNNGECKQTPRNVNLNFSSSSKLRHSYLRFWSLGSLRPKRFLGDMGRSKIALLLLPFRVRTAFHENAVCIPCASSVSFRGKHGEQGGDNYSQKAFHEFIPAKVYDVCTRLFLSPVAAKSPFFAHPVKKRYAPSLTFISSALIEVRYA